MSRAVPRIVVLSLVVAAFAAGPAVAAQRYASPGGTGPVATCPQIDPCSIADAVVSTSTDTGDEVILAAGDYAVAAALDVLDGVDVHGLGIPSQTRIVSTAGIGVYLGNAGAKLRNVEVSHSTGSNAAVYVQSGTVDRVIAKSVLGSACAVFNATIRDSICATSGSGRAGIFINISGTTYSIALRNVTAIGAGATNSMGIFAGASTGTTVSFDAKSVIVSGTTYDIYASASGAGASSTVTLDHSNYLTVLTAGAATVTATSLNSNQTAAPVFVNEADKYFHQATGSPTIDAGVLDGSSGATDVDGEARTQGSAADIGADEFDAVAPAAPSIISPASGSITADATPTISGTAEANRTVAVLTDGNPAGTTSADGSGDWSLDIPLADGTFAITATAANLNNIASPASSSVTLKVDTTAPSASISSPVNGRLYNGDPVALAYSATDTNPGTTECQVDGAAYGACEASLDLSDGSHTVNVRHTDAADNVGTASSTFTVDGTAPTVSISSPASGLHNGSPIAVVVGPFDGNLGNTQCSIDGGAFGPCPADLDLADGSHTLDARHTDAAGNVGNAAQVSFTIDGKAPQTKVRKGPKAKTTKRKAKFTFASSEAGSTFKCKLDRRAFKPCKSPFTKRVKPGKHKFQVVATDAAGNRDATPAVYRWKVRAG